MNRVIVVGDAMLDEYIYGEVTRISPEAPTPVLHAKRSERMVGGAANVARGIAALDCEVDFITVCNSADEAGRAIMSELSSTDRLLPWVAVDARLTTHKRRYVSEAHHAHMLRVDSEDVGEIDFATQQTIMKNLHTCLPDAAVVVLSDYCKGVLTPDLVRNIIAAARLNGKIIIVDTKNPDLKPYIGADIIKLNESELKAARLPASELMQAFDYVIVTQGERGAMVTSLMHNITAQIPGRPVRVQDVSGAGDTFVATLAATLAADTTTPIETAAKRAIQASAIAVGKPGTAVVTLAELNGGKCSDDRDTTLLDQRLIEWRGKRIGFTNGCFDLLHAGHLHMLQTAKANCDKLIVGVNSDASVRGLKGDGRPIQSHIERAEVLSHLDYVDLVVIFDGEPTEIVERIRPAVMFKGMEYFEREVSGREFAGTMHFVERTGDGPSTTGIVNRILAKSLDDWCEECHGPCNRRPRHGEANL